MKDRMLSDEILLGIINSKSGGGGGGGTSNYNDLSNQPQINGNTLVGNKTASDLGLVAAEAGKGLSSNDYTDDDKAIVGGVTAALADKADKSAVKNEFLGTLDEWNALTVEQRKAYDTYQIKGDYADGSGGMPDYSTTEQKTGQKWIDGKDIYRLVIVLNSATIFKYNDWVSIPFSGNDYSAIVNAFAIGADGSFCPLIVGRDGSNTVVLACRVDSSFIATTVVVEYAKQSETT